MPKQGGSSHIYVVGEVGVPDVPVKIGIHEGSGSSTGRPGLGTGNWRKLKTLYRRDVLPEDLRWQEWLIHKRLESRHERGEWYWVRDLVPDNDWGAFLDAVYENSLPGLVDWRLEARGHQLTQMKRIVESRPRRHFVAICSCGAQVDGGAGSSLPTVQARFAVEHLGLRHDEPGVVALTHRSARTRPTEPGDVSHTEATQRSS